MTRGQFLLNSLEYSSTRLTTRVVTWYVPICRSSIGEITDHSLLILWLSTSKKTTMFSSDDRRFPTKSHGASTWVLGLLLLFIFFSNFIFSRWSSRTYFASILFLVLFCLDKYIWANYIASILHLYLYRTSVLRFQKEGAIVSSCTNLCIYFPLYRINRPCFKSNRTT
jgi:hypothetical protein